MAYPYAASRVSLLLCWVPMVPAKPPPRHGPLTCCAKPACPPRPRAAASAREYRFHPTEIFEEQEDGSLLIRFTAGSDLEMCHYFFSWGDALEILQPASLRQKYIDMLDQVRQLYDPPSRN